MSTGPRLFNISMDGLSAVAIVGSLAQVLPPLAALAGIIWYAIQIYESKTVQTRLRAIRLRKRLNRIKAQGSEAWPPPAQPPSA